MNVPTEPRSTATPARARRGNHAEMADDSALRARVERAALRAFAERGYHGTTVPKIAKDARVGVGSIYRHFDSKERLVNAVFRGAKARLRDALLLDLDLGAAPDALFAELWARLATFARDEPVTFQFLELQDHAPYLDAESRALEASVLAPLLAATASAARLPPQTGGVLIAIVWGAVVALTKAARLGYLRLDDDTIRRAGALCAAAAARARDDAARDARPLARSTSSKKKKKKGR